MRYLITTKTEPPFLSDFLEPVNHFNPEIGMIVYDVWDNKYTTDGKNWQDIESDNL